MKTSKITIIMGLVFCCFLFFCSSDEESPTTPTQTYDPPTFTVNSVTFPAAMESSSDDMAKETISEIEKAMTFEGTGCCFCAPNACETVKNEKTAWEYSWKEEELTRNLKITAISGRNMWQVFYDGSADGVNFSSWRYQDALQTTDQSDGHVHLYKEGTNQLQLEWVWYTLENGDYKFIKQCFSDPCFKYDIVSHPDNSGKLERFAMSSTGNLVYDLRVSWDAEGNGAWWTFSDGAQTDSGTW